MHQVSLSMKKKKNPRDFRHLELNFKDTGSYENVLVYTLSVENSPEHELPSNEKLRVCGDTMERKYTVFHPQHPESVTNYFNQLNLKWVLKRPAQYQSQQKTHIDTSDCEEAKRPRGQRMPSIRLKEKILTRGFPETEASLRDFLWRT